MNYSWQSDPYRTGPPGYGGFWSGGNWQQPTPPEMPSHNTGPGPANPQFSAEFYAPDPRLVRAPLLPPPPPPPPPQPMNFNPPPPPPQQMNYNYGNAPPPPPQNMQFNQGNAPPPSQQMNFSHGNTQPPQHANYNHGNAPPPPPQHMNFSQGNAPPPSQHGNFNQGNAPPPPQHANFNQGYAPPPPPPSVPSETAPQGPQPHFRQNQQFESENRGRGARGGRGGGRGRHADISNNSPRQQFGGRGRDFGPPAVNQEQYHPNVEQSPSSREGEEPRPDSHGSELIEEHGPYFWRNKNSPPANQKTPVKAELRPDFPNKAPEVQQERGRPNFQDTRGQGRYFDSQVRDEPPAFNRQNPVRGFEAHQRVADPEIEERKFIPLDSTQDFSSMSANTSMETNTQEMNRRLPDNRVSEMQDLHSTSRDGQPGTSGNQFPNPRPGPGPKKKKNRGKKGRGGLNSRTPHSFEQERAPQGNLSRNQTGSSDLPSVTVHPEQVTSNVNNVREVNLSNASVTTVPVASVQEGSAQQNRQDFADDYFPSNFESGSSAPPAQPVSMIPGLDVTDTQEERPDAEAERVRSIVEASQTLLDTLPDINAVRRMLQTLDSEDEDSFPEASSSNPAKPSASGKKTSASLHSSKKSSEGRKGHLTGPSFTQRSHVNPSPLDRLPNPPPPPSISDIRNALEASNLRLSDLGSFLAQEGNSDRSLYPNPATRQLRHPNSDLRRSQTENFREFSGDVDLRKTLLPTPRQANDNLSGPFRDTSHLSNIVESLTEGGGIRQTGSDLRLDSESFGARDCDMRNPRLLDTFSGHMDVDHREMLFDRRAIRDEEFLERDVDSRLSPVSLPLRGLSAERGRMSTGKWGNDVLGELMSRSPRSLTPQFERDVQERWEEPLERVSSPEEGLSHLPRTRSRSPVVLDPLGRRSSPLRHGRREGSPLSPRRRHSRRHSRSRSRERSPRRVRSRYSRSPRGSDRHRGSRQRRSSPSPRRFHRRSRSPTGNLLFGSRSRSRSPVSFRSHNSRHRSRSPPFHGRRTSPGAGSRSYRSRSPSLKSERERTAELEMRAAYPSGSFVDEPPRNMPFYDHGLPPRDLPLTHAELQYRELPVANIQYSVPPPTLLPAVESVPNINVGYSVPPPPVVAAVAGVPIVPNGNEVRSIPIVSKPVLSSKPAVKGRPNLCVINTSNKGELVEPVPVVKPVEVSEVNADEDAKKQQQELKEKRKARAVSRRVEFANKHEKLIKELMRLKNQNAELTIKQMQIYGDREVERLGLLVLENAKLQNAVTKQIKTIGGVIKKLDLVLQNKDSVSLTARKNYKFFDPQNHWCEVCKEFFGDLCRYVEHCHSAAHKKKAAKSTPVDINEKLPWCSDTDSPDSQVPDTAAAGSCQIVPFDGSQFLIPVEAMYCKLCKEFIGDSHCALRHVNTSKHHDAYLEYITNNPDWECTWMEARQTAFKEFIVEQKAKAELKAKEEAERKKLLEEQQAKEYETFIKREESQRGNVEELDDSGQGTTTSEVQKSRGIRVNVNLNN